MKKILAGLILSVISVTGYGQCSGTLTLNSGSGTITDGPGNYSSSQNCSWLIQPTGGGAITINFTSFSTESGYDYLRVYDGNSSSSPLLGTYSGSSLPPSLTSSGSSLYLRFTSDGSITRSGFELNYTSCTFPKPTLAYSSTSYCNSDILLATVIESGYSYQWYKNGNPVAGQTGSSFLANGPGEYYVSKSNGTCTSNSSPVNITSALSEYSIWHNSSSICSGESKTLTVSNSSSLTYQWFLDGVAISGANTNSYNASIAGNYSVSYTNSYSGCTRETDSVYVNVIASPVKPVISVSGSLELCNASIPPVLTSDVSPIVWNTGETSTSILGNTAGAYYVTSTNGICSVISDTIIVTDNSPNSSILTDYNEVCSGSVIAVSGSGLVDVSDDFSSSTTSNWSINTGSYAKDCYSSQTGALYFYHSGTRQLVTNSLDLSAGALVSFDLEIGDCESADSGEDVVLEIENSGGYYWNTLKTVNNSTSGKNTYSVTIPASHGNNSVKLRWRQRSNSGSGTDTWTIDNVSITSNVSNSNATYSWSPSAAFSSSSSQNTFLSVDSVIDISLTVTDASSGCSSISSKTINVNQNYLGLSISPTGKSICAGDQVNFIGSLTDNTRNVHYSWNSNGEVMDVDSARTYGNLNTTQGVELVATDLTTGCSAAVTSAIAVNQYPGNPVLTTTGTLCIDDSVTIQAANSVNWSNGYVGNSIIVTSPGDYYAYSGSNSCVSYSDTITLTDDSPNSIILTDYNEVCSGSVISVSGASLVDISDDFSSSTTSNWSINTGSYIKDCYSSQTGALYFYHSGTRQLVTNSLDLSAGALVSFDLEIGDCESADSGEDVVLEIENSGGYYWNTLKTVNNSTSGKNTYSVTIPASHGNNSVKLRWRQRSNSGSGTDTWTIDNVSITSNVSNSNATYSWSPSAAFSSSSSQNTFLSVDSVIDISLTVTDASSGCSSISSKTINVNQNYLGLSISPTGKSICAGDQVNFIGSLTDNTRNVHYSWNSNGEVMDVDSARTYGNLNTTQGVELVATDLTTGCSVAVTSAIAVNQYPGNPVLSTTGSLCIDDSVTIQADSPVNWSDGSFGNSITTSASGHYYAYTGSNSCVSYSDTITLTDNSPHANISVTNPGICPGGIVELSAVANGFEIVDDFSSRNSGFWSSNTGTYTSACQSSGRLFFESNASVRELVSNTIDLSSGGEIRFNLEVSECESIESHEEVVLQISTNGGWSWNNLRTYYYASHTTPKNEVYTLSANSSYSNAMIRWKQESHDGSGTDTWSLDDVSIKSNASHSNGTYSYSWSPANLVENPSSDITYTKPVNSASAVSLTVTDINTGCQSSAVKIIDVTNGTVSGNPQILSSANQVCSGGKVELQVFNDAVGSGGIVDDFSSSNSSNWSVNSGSLYSDCSSYNGALNFHHSGDRELITRSMDLSSGAQVTFDIRMGHCENADMGEDVVFQISNNGGITWTILKTIAYNATYLNTVSVSIPASMQNSNAKLRWFQLEHHGLGYDTWMIDNVEINPVAVVSSSGRYDYSWSPSNAFETAANGNSVITNPIYGPTSYSVQITDSITNCSTSLLKVINISSNSLTVDIISSNDSICHGGNTQLTAAVDGDVNDYSKYSYAWTPSAKINNDTLFNPVVTNLLNQTNFVLTVTDKLSNCSGAALKIIAPSGSVQKPTVSQISNFLVCNEYSSDLQWYHNGNIIYGETGQLLNLAETGYANGCYTVAYNGGECQALSNCFDVITTSVASDLAGKEGINVTLYPNPVNDKLNVEFNLEYMASDAVLKVYSVSGQDVTGQVQMSQSFGGSGMSMDVVNLPAGIYFLNVKTDSKEGFESFVKYK